MTLLVGDCRQLMPGAGPFDLILADPPYAATALAWDRQVDGWLELACAALKPTGSIWVFGSLRSFLRNGPAFRAAGLRLAQEIVWHKQNGSGFHADRFRRVHELVAQFYRHDQRWRTIYNQVQTTHDAVARSVLRSRRPAHTGAIGPHHYVTRAGGPRLMRSVLAIRNCHRRAIHPTQKPVALLEILVRTSCPPDGLVGDWFAGSGAAGVACRNAQRRYVGCEIDPAIAARAAERLDRPSTEPEL